MREPTKKMENTNPKKISNIQLLNIVSFCALMQNGEGIVGKSPDYILEKFHKYALQTDSAFYWGLDAQRKGVIQEWAIKWVADLATHDHSTDHEVDYMRALAEGAAKKDQERADEKRDEMREDGIST